MNNKKITIDRKFNLILGARKFKIIIDGQEIAEIGNAEIKIIEIPYDTQQLKLKVMNYESKTIDLNSAINNSFVVKQNVLSSMSSLLVAIFAVVFLIFKFILEQDKLVVLFFAFPFVIASIYFSTFGRKKVIQIENKEEI